MTKVITYGTYDMLHYGHIRLLERAKALGDYLIVGVTSDSYDRTRGKINNQQSLMERVAAVRDTGIADEIIIEEYPGQKIDDIKKYGIDIFTVGSDWEGQFDYLNEYCRVIYLPRTEGISSTAIRSDSRKIKVGVVGELSYRKKFEEEMRYVNGVELCGTADESADAVYVASMPKNHYRDVKTALLAGKHVICQSPIATEEAQCRELLKLAAEKGLVLYDAIKTAYLTAYFRLLLLVKSGIIGEIVSVDSVCTSLEDGAWEENADLNGKQNSICGWGPTALLPIFQILGTEYRSMQMVSRYLDKEKKYDGFTKIDFIFDNAVASAKVAKGAKSEGQLVITGTKGYVFVPAPWWRTDYFEVRYEDVRQNKKYFYQLDGIGIRYEIVEFVKAIRSGAKNSYVNDDVSIAISKMIQEFYNDRCVSI